MKLEIGQLFSFFMGGKKKIPDCCQPQHHNTFSLKLIFCKINITTIFHLVLSSPAREPRQGFVDSIVGQNSFSPSASGYHLWARWSKIEGVSEPCSSFLSWNGPSKRSSLHHPNTECGRKWMKRLRAQFFPPTSFLLLSWHKSRKPIFYLPLIPSAETKVFWVEPPQLNQCHNYSCHSQIAWFLLIEDLLGAETLKHFGITCFSHSRNKAKRGLCSFSSFGRCSGGCCCCLMDKRAAAGPKK